MQLLLAWRRVDQIHLQQGLIYPLWAQWACLHFLLKQQNAHIYHILFLNISVRPIFLKWKFHTNYTIMMVTTCFRICTGTVSIQSNGEKLCRRRGSNLQPWHPRWRAIILTVFCVFPAFLVQWLLGIIILGPDMLDPVTILMVRSD